MELISGTYHDGRVDLDRSVDWPEGTEVEVSRTFAPQGRSEEQWPQDPEQIERLLKEWESIQPLVFTTKELVDFETTRKQMGRQSIEKLDATMSNN